MVSATGLNPLTARNTCQVCTNEAGETAFAWAETRSLQYVRSTSPVIRQYRSQE